MTAKTGLHAHANNATTRAALAYSWPIVKELDGTDLLLSLKGTPTILVLRDSRTDAADSQTAANYLLGHAITSFDPAKFWVQITTETARGFDPAWQTGVVQALRNGGYQGGILIGGWPTGNPTQYDTTTHADGTPHFPAVLPLVPLLGIPGVGLALDAYTSILSTDPRWAAEEQWMPDRYELIHHCCELHGVSPRVIITESGADDGEPAPSKTGSWTGRGWTAAQYVATLQALDAIDQQYDYVLGRCIFTLGADAAPEWQPYEIAPIVPQLAAYVQSQASIGVGGGVPPVAILGFDISNNNGAVNIAAAKAAGYVFGYAKASEGTTFKDWTFASNWAAMKSAGLVRGAYHWVIHGLDAGAQAHAFAAMVGQLQPGDFIMCDSEDTNATIQQNVDDAAAWCAAVEPLMGVKPFVYLDNNQATNADCSALARYPLILADYQGPVPPIPPAWKQITIWQHTNKANVAGVAGYCDEDFGLVSLDQLRALGYQPPAPPVPVPPPVDPAETFYFQTGHKVNTDFALWKVTLKPLYDFAQQLKAQQHPLVDLIQPGPLAGAETGTTWGGTRPASVVKLTNQTVGAYQDAAGVWRPFRPEG